MCMVQDVPGSMKPSQVYIECHCQRKSFNYGPLLSIKGMHGTLDLKYSAVLNNEWLVINNKINKYMHQITMQFTVL